MTKVQTGQIIYLPVSQLSPHPDNPRKSVGDVTELADSIKAAGILQNLTVVPNIDDPEYGYTVIIGHRRLAAAKKAGLEKAPCVIAKMDHREQVQTMLLENMQRSDLTVYEQAQGFQMMLDLGASVEEIAEKSGFSKATVRRRVKMMELDQEVLTEVSSRQLSLGDFDRLAQVEDIEERNTCLSKIGTADFNQKVSASLRQQAIRKKLPIVKERIKKAKAKALKQSEAWSGKYNRRGATIYLADWEPDAPLIPENFPGELYYTLDEAFGHLSFFEKAKRAQSVKRSEEEIEKERRISAAWDAADEKAAMAYSLRSAFVHGLNWGPKNAIPILRGSFIASMVNMMLHISADRDSAEKLLDLEEGSPVTLSEYTAKIIDALKNLDNRKLPLAVYTLFGDKNSEGYAAGYRKRPPEHNASPKLDALYYWLITLGYEMSAEEIALQDGTHEIFQREQEETAP